MQAAQGEIEAQIRTIQADRVALAFHDLATGQEILIDADVPFHPASTIKLCVMVALYYEVAAGFFTLDSPLLIKNEFASIADGSAFSLSADDDSEQTLYGRIGEPETLREINRLMIVQSSNLATNLLIDLLSAEKITARMQEMGVSGLKVLRGPEDNRAYALGMNNVATARGLMLLLRQLAEGRVITREASHDMVAVLLGQKYNEGIPAGLPEDVLVAHKTGWNDHLYHDAALVFPPGRAPYVVVLMTRGLPEATAAPRLVANIARRIHASISSTSLPGDARP